MLEIVDPPLLPPCPFLLRFSSSSSSFHLPPLIIDTLFSAVAVSDYPVLNVCVCELPHNNPYSFIDSQKEQQQQQQVVNSSSSSSSLSISEAKEKLKARRNKSRKKVVASSSTSTSSDDTWNKPDQIQPLQTPPPPSPLSLLSSSSNSQSPLTFFFT